MDFSPLDAACADAFGESVTLRRNGQDDTTITAVFTEAASERAVPGLITQIFVVGGISKGDQIIRGEDIYTVGPVTTESTGAMRADLKKN